MVRALKFENFRLPAIITSEAQNKVYTEKLLSLESKKRRSAGEKAFVEILTCLIEQYEKKNYPMDSEEELIQALCSVIGYAPSGGVMCWSCDNISNNNRHEKDCPVT